MVWAVVAVVVLMRVFSSKVYDVIICNMTAKWYASVLERLGKGDKVLDVGIGTATALLRNKLAVVQKELRVVGVDYDQAYITSADSDIKAQGLEKQIQVHCASIFDSGLAAMVRKDGEEAFDCAYFSGSWTLMPSPVEALRIAAALVKPNGKVYVTQTFQRKATPFLGTIKPMLKYLTTIDFGPLHYESQLQEYIDQAAAVKDGLSLQVEENIIVPGSIDNQFQSARLLVFTKVEKK